jgi:hypothetical protein
VTPEEGGLYYVRIRELDVAVTYLTQFRAGEFLFFGTDNNAAPDEVQIVAKVLVVAA